MKLYKPNETIPDHYSPECPICKGVLLPERVKELEKEVASRQLIIDTWQGDMKQLQQQLKAAEEAADQWRDLYQAKEI